MDEIILRDQNFVTVLAGITDDSNQYIRMLRVDPTTGRLLVSATGGGGGGTPGGSTTQLQYNNAGAFGGISGATTNGTAVTFATNGLIANNILAAGSGGLLIESNSGTDVALFGAGGGSGATFYGGVNVAGNLTVDTNTLFVDATNNFIGFGTLNPLAPIELRATRATIAFESSGLTGNIPFTDTASLGAWASTSYIGAISQMSQANGGLAFQGFTNSASASGFALAGHVGSTTPTASAITLQGWKSNGTTGRTAMTGTEKLLDITPGVGTAVFTLTAGGALGLGDNTPATNASRLSIVGGTGTTGIPFQYLSGTLSTTGSETGAQYLITSPATAGTYSHAGLRVEFLAGYTGTGATRAFYSDNQVAGTGSDLRWNTSYSSPTGNSGGNMWASATTTGTNVGNFAEAKGGNVNVGLFGRAAAVKNSATNIGVIGHGRNTGTSPIQVGGWFSLANTAPTFVSAALVADNGDTTSPIFLGRDNGTTTFTIADGGVVTSVQDIQVTNVGTTSTSVLTTQGTQTVTNKRITDRVTTITSSATPTVNTDNCDAVTITALATAITSMTTNLTGTPTNFQKLVYRIKDDGTARAITWGASFVAMGVALPTTTVLGKILTVGFIYDTVLAKWGCVASVNEA